jgi:protein-L-isoaspartate O-methyltransferase
MSAQPDRARRFIFDSVVDDYVHGRPEMPLEAVRAAVDALDLPSGARVLEIGAGTGQLTGALVDAGFRVVALEPGVALRRRAAERAPAAELKPFFSVSEAAAYYCCDPQRIYDLRSSGRLSRYSDGGRALVSRAELDALVLPPDAGGRSTSGPGR